MDCLCLARGLATGQVRPARPRRGLQWPERSGVVRVGIVVGHGRLALLFYKYTPTGEQLHRAGDDLVQHRPIVFYCHVGARSLDAAAYYAGHGFKNVRSMTGGIDAWSSEVDESVPRYEVAPDPYSGVVTLRTLRSVVSQEAGCRSKSARKTTFESSLP